MRLLRILFIFALTSLVHCHSNLKRHFDENESPADELAKSTLPMHYNGGEVMTRPLKLVYIFYGKFKKKTVDNLEFFARHLGKSKWYGVTTTYYDSTTTHVSTNVTLDATWFDNYSIGKSFKKRSSTTMILLNALKANKMKADPNTLYNIIISKDVDAMQFCEMYCGFHRHVKRKDGALIKYTVTMDPTKCPGLAPISGSPKGSKGCLQKPWRNTTQTLNHDQISDSIINILAHEISEAVTDPLSPKGWTDGRKKSFENGDKCNQKFGELKHVNIGGKKTSYNTEMGPVGSKRKYLIQQMWDVVKQKCTLSKN